MPTSVLRELGLALHSASLLLSSTPSVLEGVFSPFGSTRHRAEAQHASYLTTTAATHQAPLPPPLKAVLPMAARATC